MDKSEQIGRAVEVLRGGGVVVFPTDTVWGVGAAVSSREGIEKFYQVKGRGGDKPSQVLVSGVDMANRYGVMDKLARRLVGEYWPGALTVVVKARGNRVPKIVRGGSRSEFVGTSSRAWERKLGRVSTVGLRAPDHELVQKLIKRLGEGVVAASANFAGEVAPRTFEEVDKIFLGKVDFALEGKLGRLGSVVRGLGLAAESSTVVDVSGGRLRMIRQGEVRVNVSN